MSLPIYSTAYRVVCKALINSVATTNRLISFAWLSAQGFMWYVYNQLANLWIDVFHALSIIPQSHQQLG
jgi:hypothetical protein